MKQAVQAKLQKEEIGYVERVPGDPADKPATLAELQAEQAKLQEEIEN